MTSFDPRGFPDLRLSELLQQHVAPVFSDNMQNTAPTSPMAQVYTQNPAMTQPQQQIDPRHQMNMFGILSNLEFGNQIDAIGKQYNSDAVRGMGIIQGAAGRVYGAAKNLKTVNDKYDVDREKALKNVGEANVVAGDAINKARSAYDSTIAPIQARIQGYRDQVQKEINPQRFLQDKGTGGTVLAALSVALGGFGAGLTGGPNVAAQIIQQSIDNDIKSQLDKKNGLRDLLAEGRQQLGDLGNLLNSDMSVIEMIRVRKMDEYKAQLESIAQQQQGTQLGFNALHAAALMEQSAGEKAIGITNGAADLALKGASAKASNAANIAENFTKAEDKYAEKSAKARASNAQLDAVDSGITKLEDFVFGVPGKEGAGRQLFKTDKAVSAQSMSKGLQLLVKEVLKLGALDKGSIEYLHTIVPEDPTQLNQGAVREKLKSLRGLVDSIRQSQTGELAAKNQFESSFQHGRSVGGAR